MIGVDKSVTQGPLGQHDMSGGRIAELYARHADWARRYAYILTGDSSSAEDLVQDAFLRLATRFVHLRHPSSFDAYLRRMILNRARSQHRRRSAEARAYALLRNEPSPSYERDVEGARFESMRAAILDLLFRQRAALTLRFLEDLDYDQCAILLRCRPATVRSLVSRGLQKLREEMEQP